MAIFNIKYSITASYEAVVNKAIYHVLVMPCSDEYQQMISFNTEIFPVNEKHISLNTYGFSVLQIGIHKPFTNFSFQASMKVKMAEKNPFNFLPLPVEQEWNILNSIEYLAEYLNYLRSTPLTEITHSELSNFPKPDKTLNSFDYYLKLNTFVHEFLNYTSDLTNVETTIHELLKLRQGVCQDYAHLFTSICRKQNLVCRYVSGYLIQNKGFVGDLQMHAWVEVHIPKVGWLGLDPTNNLLVDHHYIKVSHGADYSECAPIKGVLENFGEQNSVHTVIIQNQEQQ